MTRRAADAAQEKTVQLAVDSVTLEGSLGIPPQAQGVVLFAHGSGSSRHSPRNQFVARILREQGLATLLFDLLTAEEEKVDQQTGELRFDIDLLAERLVQATAWLLNREEAAGLKIGYFGASTGAAAALIAAAQAVEVVKAVVSRGGRPDLAEQSLPQVQAPTLFIVGGDDRQVLRLNLKAATQLPSKKKVEVISGIDHLFEEEWALEQVAQLAGEWFHQYLDQAD